MVRQTLHFCRCRDDLLASLMFCSVGRTVPSRRSVGTRVPGCHGKHCRPNHEICLFHNTSTNNFNNSFFPSSFPITKSSSALVKKPRNASYLSVVSFIASIVKYLERSFFIISYFGFRFTSMYNSIIFYCFWRNGRQWLCIAREHAWSASHCKTMDDGDWLIWQIQPVGTLMRTLKDQTLAPFNLGWRLPFRIFWIEADTWKP